MRKRIFKYMCYFFLFSLFLMPVNAAEKEPTETDHIISLVESYMNARTDLIANNISESEWTNIAVKGVYTDEVRRALLLDEQKIYDINSIYNIVNVDFQENFIEVEVIESVCYNKSILRDVMHKLLIMCDCNGNYILLSDKYIEDYTTFTSCSYIEVDENNQYTQLSSTASSGCILYIAGQEIGYTEENTNETKYGKWFGMDGESWCHMFVSWCANKAGISTSIIPKTADCDTGMNSFKNWNKFKYSYANGGNYSPKSGDIIYFGTTSDASHVGIVSSISGNTITTIEGNSSDQVRKKTYSLTNTSIIGYGTPAYATTTHSFVTYGAQYKCSRCGLVVSQIPEGYSIK